MALFRELLEWGAGLEGGPGPEVRDFGVGGDRDGSEADVVVLLGGE